MESGKEDYEELHEVELPLVTRQVIRVPSGAVTITAIESEPSVGKPGIGSRAERRRIGCGGRSRPS